MKWTLKKAKQMKNKKSLTKAKSTEHGAYTQQTIEICYQKIYCTADESVRKTETPITNYPRYKSHSVGSWKIEGMKQNINAHRAMNST